MQSLLEALGATRGILSVVGAGGKKSLMRRLAGEHPGRVFLTTTVRIPPLGAIPDGVVVIATSDELPARVAEAAARHRIVVGACPETRKGRYEGVPAELVPALHAAGGFDLTLVKADGARMRFVKVPGDDEPCIAAGSTLLVPVSSVSVLGRPLDERCAHRPERVAEVTGAVPGEPIAPLHLARLLASPEGGLRRGEGIEVVPMVTHADDEHTLAAAREVARLALGLSDRFERVVLAALRAPQPLREVVRR